MKRLFEILRMTRRAMRISDFAHTKFDTVVFSCANLSRVNNSLAFVVRRSGVFGVPVVESIPRPDVVALKETDDCVIVKDGKTYELKAW